jgi:hypothetical protein
MAGISRPSQFLALVQEHERSWGGERYPGRPSLEALLNAEVVAFWHEDDEQTARKVNDRYFVTLHRDLAEIERHFLLLLRGASRELHQRRLVKLFERGEKCASPVWRSRSRKRRPHRDGRPFQSCTACRAAVCSARHTRSGVNGSSRRCTPTAS